MTRRHNMRALVALSAAYALALQVILLAFGASMGAQATGLGGLPTCSSLASSADPGIGSGPSAANLTSNSAPVGHGGGCSGPCLGCCCGPLACRIPGPAMTYAPAPARIIIIAFVAPAPF